MIKRGIIVMILLLCNFCIAQKQFIEKTYNSEYYEGCKEVTFNVGKPVFIMVYINSSTPNDSLIAVREFNELKNNFKEANFYFLQKRGKIKLNNAAGETINFDQLNEDYKKIIYWNGKKESDLTEYDELIQSSEYFSKILKANKTSSYINDYNAQISSFNKQKVWQPDENSKKLSDKYLKYFLFEQFKVFGDYSDFLNFDFKGVQKLVISSNMKGIKNPWQEIYFNKDGLPTKAIVSKENSDGTKITVSYEYKDNLLSKISVKVNEQKYDTPIYYSDKNLIVDKDSRIIFYKMNSVFLTYKSYYINQSNFDFLIDTYNLTSTNELKYVESSGLNNKTTVFKNTENFLPATITIRPEADAHSKIITTLTKTDELNYVGTANKVTYLKIKYSNKNLISEVLFSKPDGNSQNKKTDQYKFDFKYEYYK